MCRETFMRFIVIILLVLPSSVLALDVGDPAPPFEAQTTAGDKIVLAKMKGNNAIFLTFWATWCQVCKTEIPRLKEIHAQYAPKGMPLIAINVGVNDSVKKVQKYLEHYGITYPVIFDTNSKITKLYGVQGTPTVVIIDKRGVVRYRSAAIPGDLNDHFSGLMKDPAS